MVADSVKQAGAFTPVLGYGFAAMVLDRAQLRARLAAFIAAGGASADDVERLASAVQAGADEQQAVNRKTPATRGGR